MRVFLAINFDRSLQDELADLQEKLKERTGSGGIKWVKPELLHLTLKFLGEVHPEDIEKFAAPLQAAVQDVAAFDLSLAGLGVFPGAHAPRVVWIGIREGASQTKLLAGKIEQFFLNNNDKSNQGAGKTDFVPHLTLGRKKKEASLHLPKELFREPWELKHICRVDRFFLMKSTLYSSGPVYSPLKEFLLSGA